jgi:ATP-dependent DNA helicase MPH1
MCYEALLDLESGTKSDNGKRKYPQKKLAEEPLFKTIMRLFKQREQASNSASMVHPKMDRLRSLLLQYFADQPPVASDSDSANKEAESKVMVFASYRRAVEQIVNQLNLDAPIIRAHRFIGQAATKDGVKGLSQREQLKVLLNPNSRPVSFKPNLLPRSSKNSRRAHSIP